MILIYTLIFINNTHLNLNAEKFEQIINNIFEVVEFSIIGRFIQHPIVSNENYYNIFRQQNDRIPTYITKNKQIWHKNLVKLNYD